MILARQSNDSEDSDDSGEYADSGQSDDYGESEDSGEFGGSVLKILWFWWNWRFCWN